MKRERKRAMENTFVATQRITEEENWDRDLKHTKWGEADIG